MNLGLGLSLSLSHYFDYLYYFFHDHGTVIDQFSRGSALHDLQDCSIVYCKLISASLTSKILQF
jgi:hypothetical protein